MRHVVFRLEADRYALPLDAVREVVNAPERYGRVPHAKRALKGVMTLRGRVVPVADLAAVLASATLPAPRPGSKVVLLELSRRELGLLVTEVDGIETIEPPGAPARTSRMVRGVARLGPGTVTVLDADGLDAAVAASITSG
jgi:purine-binding chemotaxis protein CheW